MLESEVLKPKDPTIHSDDWPIFHLDLAVVYQKLPTNLCSLLSADTQNAVTVRGLLRAQDIERKQVVRKIPKEAVQLEIQNVRFYAFDSSDDGDIILWAAGEAGWYEIHSAMEYLPVYEGMTEAVQLLHSLEDKYKHAKLAKGRQNFSGTVEDVWEMYTKENVECVDTRQAARLFYKHRDFLIAHMLKEEGSIRWRRTPFYRHMRSRFESDFHRIHARHAVQEGTMEMSDDDTGEIGDDASPSKSPLPHSTPSPAETTTSSSTKPLLLYRHFDKVRLAGRIRRSDMSLDGFSEALYEDYALESPAIAKNIILAYAIGLMLMLKSASTRQGSTFDWTTCHVYQELSSAVAIFILQDIEEAEEYLAITLQRRKTPLTRVELNKMTRRSKSQQITLPTRPAPSSASSLSNPTRPVFTTPVAGTKRSRDRLFMNQHSSPSSTAASLHPPRSSHASKGSLRLKDKFSAKGPPARRPNPPDFLLVSDNDDNNGVRASTSLSTRRPAQNLTPLSISPRSDIDQEFGEDKDEEEDDRGSILSGNAEARLKRHRPGSHVPPDDPLSSPILPNPHNRGPGKGRLSSQPLSSILSGSDEAINLDGIFTCTVDGCLTRIFEARTLKGQVQIRDHFRSEHRDESRERLELVLEESWRVNHSGGRSGKGDVSFLVERIRAMAKNNKEQEEREMGKKSGGRMIEINGVFTEV